MDKVLDRTAYRFWNGKIWDEQVTDVASLFTGVPGGMSVSYNDYLKQYLAVYSEALSSRIVIRLARAPEGPWSDPLLLFNGLSAPNGTWDYAGLEHPELAMGGGQTIAVSYYHPTGQLSGELRLVMVNFNQAAEIRETLDTK